MAPGAHDADSAALRRVTRVAVTVAATLAAAKALTWLVSGSVAVLASMVDSVADTVMSSVTLIAVRVARSPPDAEHRFGHGKVEPLAGLAQAAFVLGSAAFVAIEAVRRATAPEPIAQPAVAIAVMGVSLGATGWLVLYQLRVARRVRSIALRGDAMHYLTDIAGNVAVILGLVMTIWAEAPILDPIIGIAVALALVYGAVGIARDAFAQLMDRELPDDERARVFEIAAAEPIVRDVHDVKTRQAGHQRFIQLHLTMDGEMSLADAHRAGQRVADALREAFPGAQVLVHHDPGE